MAPVGFPQKSNFSTTITECSRNASISWINNGVGCHGVPLLSSSFMLTTSGNLGERYKDTHPGAHDSDSHVLTHPSSTRSRPLSPPRIAADSLPNHPSSQSLHELLQSSWAQDRDIFKRSFISALNHEQLPVECVEQIHHISEHYLKALERFPTVPAVQPSMPVPMQDFILDGGSSRKRPWSETGEQENGSEGGIRSTSGSYPINQRIQSSQEGESHNTPFPQTSYGTSGPSRAYSIQIRKTVSSFI